MQAGKLRTQLTLQQLVAASPQQKASGEPDMAWSTVATVYSEVRALRGIALFNAQQQQSGIEVEIEIRYRSGVTANMRFRDGSVAYDIKSVDETKKHEGRLTCMCSRGLNDG